MKKSTKVIIRILGIILAMLVLATALIFVRMATWKYKYLFKFSTLDKQNVFMLGTIHGKHIQRRWNYSFEDLLNVIDNVQPDYIYIESKEETYQQYGVLDGPQEMLLVYAYAEEKGIPVKLIDWWEINNDTIPNSTNDIRDDHIFENIISKNNEVEAGETVLIFIGSGHLKPQSQRMMGNNWSYEEINTKEYFRGTKKAFMYPASYSDWLEKGYWYDTEIKPGIIENNVTDLEKKEELLNVSSGDGYKYLLENYIPKNRLY